MPELKLSDCQFMLQEIDVSGKRWSEYNKNFLKTTRKMLYSGKPLSLKQQKYLIDLYGRATEIS